MTYIHKTEKIVLPANSQTPKLVCRINYAALQSLMIIVLGDDAKVLGSNGRDFEHGYVFKKDQQRVYTAADFTHSSKNESFELWMCAAGSTEVTVLTESIIWSDI